MTRASKPASGAACLKCATANLPMARFCARCGQPMAAWTWPCRSAATGDWKASWTELGASHKTSFGPSFLLLASGMLVVVESTGRIALLCDQDDEPLQASASLSLGGRLKAYPALLGPYLLVAEGEQLWIVDLLTFLHSGRPRIDTLRLQGQVASDLASQGSRAALITVGTGGSALEVFDYSPGGRPGRSFAHGLWSDSTLEHPHRVAILGEQAVVGGPESRLARIELSATRCLTPWPFTLAWEALPWWARHQELVLADSDFLCKLDSEGQGPRRRLGDLTTMAAGEQGVLSACGGTLIWSQEASRDVEHAFQRERFACSPTVIGNQALAVSEEGFLFLLDLQVTRLDVKASRGLSELSTPRCLAALPQAAFVAGENALYRVELS